MICDRSSVLLRFLALEAHAHQALDGENGILWVRPGLAPRDAPHQRRAIFRRDDTRSRPASLFIRDDNDLVLIEEGDTGVGRPKINTNRAFHAPASYHRTMINCVLQSNLPPMALELRKRKRNSSSLRSPSSSRASASSLSGSDRRASTSRAAARSRSRSSAFRLSIAARSATSAR